MASHRSAPPVPLPGGRAPFDADPPTARRAVFVDKDGTLVEPDDESDPGAAPRFVTGACEALAALSAAGFALVVVSNQSGIALGSFTRAQFARRQAALQVRLRHEAGVDLVDFLVCPHASGPGGAPACLCRKPAPGMLTRAARTHGLDLAGSWIIGDTLDDIEAGHRAGCRTALLLSGHGIVPSADAPASPLRTPHLKSADWLVISQRILADTISPLQSDLSHVREIPRAPAWTPPFVSC